MHGSLIGLDFEYGLSYLLGMQIGLGASGINAGANFHVASDMKKDMFFSALAIYLPGFEHLVMPSLSFATRWYFGSEYRVGLSAGVGIAMALKNAENEVLDRTYTLDEGTVLPRVAIGVAFKL
ncbi:MAG: hypothetical protein GF418_06585 [Chitinivibrionales bacterium]|nr:hypothetical protein [Chitinivibrionales bacterium]MBD3395277.1 hypothetical protein [Chitinivibrionales bacterium]